MTHRLLHLLPGHGLAHGLCHVESAHFLRLLTDGAERTTPGRKEVPHYTPRDSLLFANLLSNESPADQTGDGHKHYEGTEAAVVADLLGYLTRYVARDEPGADAHAAVVEAAEQTMLPVTSHD